VTELTVAIMHGSLCWHTNWLFNALTKAVQFLAFTFAICCRPSVCLSVVGSARAPYAGGCNFAQYFYGFRYLGHPLTSTENFTEIVPGEPVRRRS